MEINIIAKNRKMQQMSLLNSFRHTVYLAKLCIQTKALAQYPLKGVWGGV